MSDDPYDDVPLVSVLLPVRDGAEHLGAALRSLAEQTLEDFEVLAIDDGSVDRTREILDRWDRRDPRVRTLRQPASGIVSALERARREARAPYLARMDADDVALPGRLERQLELLESRPRLAGCGTRVEYVPREGLGAGARRYERWVNALVQPEEIERDVFVECPLPHPTFFFRAGALAEVGGYRDRGWPEDYDLVLRLWERGCRLGKAPDVLLRWRERPDRLSRVDEAYSLHAFRRCKVHFLRRSLLRDGRAAVVWGAGRTGKRFGRELLRQGVRLRAWVDLDPRKIGQEIHGAPVLSPDRAVGIGGPLHLAAVGQPGGRQEIRSTLRRAGLREMRDFVAVA